MRLRPAKSIDNACKRLKRVPGLAHETEFLPQLIWLLFLKSLDDFEAANEEILGDSYVPIIEPPFRWRDWAAVADLATQKTGDELREFVDNELIPYLARLSGSDEYDIRTTIGTIFQNTVNLDRDGYNLREVVNGLSALDFNSAGDVQAISLIYEAKLKELRDAAGKQGDFYTPRPLIRFILNRLAPQQDERILDPACGTAGFLVATYEQLREQVRSPQQMRTLHDSLLGIEKNPMPYLMAVMNMWLHGIRAPRLVQRDALVAQVRQIADAERVDVVATNPTFNGSISRQVLTNFPESVHTQDTAVLFVYYAMALLKRPGGRCAIIVPNGFLFGDDVASITVKKQLLTRCNLHTIVRLPNGVFAPYTSIQTNILFFKTCEAAEDIELEQPCTRQVWYYELLPPAGRDAYTKTRPLRDEEFADCIAWWDNPVECERAWKVPVEELLSNNYNLDVKNPRTKKEIEYVPPEQLVESILEKEQRIAEIIREIKQLLMRKDV
ncbi:MAG: N-6 DNA methylase [Ktedonobacteraceae bacterium]